jgi:hypothetical protein
MITDSTNLLQGPSLIHGVKLLFTMISCLSHTGEKSLSTRNCPYFVVFSSDSCGIFKHNNLLRYLDEAYSNTNSFEVWYDLPSTLLQENSSDFPFFVAC